MCSLVRRDGTSHAGSFGSCTLQNAPQSLRVISIAIVVLLSRAAILKLAVARGGEIS